MLDWLIPDSYKVNIDKLYRGRILAVLMVFCTLFWAVWTIAVLLLHAIPYGTVRIFLPTFAALLLQCYVVLSFKYKQTYYLAVSFSLLPILASAIWVTYMAGTINGTVTLYIFFIIAILFFVLLPVRQAQVAAIVLATAHISYALLPYIGIELPTRFRDSGDSRTWSLFSAITLTLIYGLLIAVLAAFSTLNRRLSEQLLTDNKKLEKMSNQDPLTRLANRRFFRDYLNNVLYKAAVRQTPFSIIYIDLDGFKPINDRLGHDVGDEVLKTLAQRISEAVRTADLVARLGGDEFAIIVDGTDSQAAQPVANKVLAAIQRPILHKQEQLHLSASLGIAAYPEHSTDASQLIKLADTAMYRAKHSLGEQRIMVSAS